MISIILGHDFFILKDFTRTVPGTISLVDMGSGNSEKTRTIISEILKHQDSLVYIPVDISEGMPFCYVL